MVRQLARPQLPLVRAYRVHESEDAEEHLEAEVRVALLHGRVVAAGGDAARNLRSPLSAGVPRVVVSGMVSPLRVRVPPQVPQYVVYRPKSPGAPAA
ncbi:hypothetical protein MN0502_02870 [Arthrobacter sp. MN05-02]|nr:hypothetical protein MN0502_02870 [Arthrobacter sp. MN05-02]